MPVVPGNQTHNGPHHRLVWLEEVALLQEGPGSVWPQAPEELSLIEIQVAIS